MSEQDFEYIQYDDEEEIQLGAIIALGFKYIKLIILCSVIGLVLFMGYNFVSSKTEKAQEAYLNEYTEYESKVQALQRTIDAKKAQFDSQVKYNSDSLLMKLNPNDYYTAKVALVVQCNKTDDYKKNISADLVASRYDEVWKFLDFSSVLKVDLPNDYLKEMISYSRSKEVKTSVSLADITNTNGFDIPENNTAMITISAMANSESDAKNIVNSLSGYLVALAPEVSNTFEKHELKVMSNSTVSKSSSLAIAETQRNNTEKESTLLNEVLKLEEDLKNLAKEEPSSLSLVKFAVIGFFVGFFLSCLYLFIQFLSRHTVYSSAYIEEYFSLPFFGSLNQKEKLTLYEKMLNEKQWNKKDAEAFIFESVRNRIPEDSKVLVMSSGSVCRENIKTITNIVSQNKIKASFVQSAHTNPETVSRVKDCDYILLLEKTWVSKATDVKQIVALAKEFDKKIVGFVSILD